MVFAVAIASGYLLGSVPFGYLLGRLKGINLRREGSGNIGAANALRVLGRPVGIVVLALDVSKGVLACWLASSVILPMLPPEGVEPNAAARRLSIAAGFAAVLGHNYPCWLRLRGGKGIATSAGVLLLLVPWGLLIAVGAFLLLTAGTRIVSVGSLGAAAVLPFGVWLAGGRGELLAMSALMGLLAIYQHRANIQRLLAGTEPRLGQNKKGEESCG